MERERNTERKRDGEQLAERNAGMLSCLSCPDDDSAVCVLLAAD